MKVHSLCFTGFDYILNGEVLTPTESQKVINHSPDGFNHGYSGSGPAQLALAIVLKIKGNSEGYQEFKNKVISTLPKTGSFDISFAL
jgi:hypothetical protein